MDFPVNSRSDIKPEGPDDDFGPGAAEPVAITRGLRDDYVESILRDALRQR